MGRELTCYLRPGGLVGCLGFSGASSGRLGACPLGLGGGMRFVFTMRAGGHGCPSSARIWGFSLGVVELNTGSSVALKLVILS
jgi:hypothetical protein